MAGVQAGLIAGHDVALWTSDAKPSAVACVSYTTKSVNDNYYLCANGINNGRYAYNNLQQYDATWYHKFSAKWHMASEAYAMYQRDVPSVYPSPGGLIAPEANTNGATCRRGAQTCFAPGVGSRQLPQPGAEYAQLHLVAERLSER